MSILASLVRAYDRLPDAPPFGFSSEKIGFLISLKDDGTVAHDPIDLREGEGKKKTARLLPVPASFKRPGVTPRAFFLWDNTAYVLGVSANEAKGVETRRAAFFDLHMELLRDSDDVGLVALRNFLSNWHPDDFARLGWPEEMKDQNVIFALESERRQRFLHQRPAAKSIWAKKAADDEKSLAVCLVTGEKAPVARLHQAIKGVWGGQVAGGSIVSFNLDAFTSYGHEQGDNAPVSEAAAFAYTTVLNRFLEKGSSHRIQIGDASTVFWADAENIEAVDIAESWGAWMLDAKPDFTKEEQAATKEIGIKLARIKKGEQLLSVEPRLEPGMRFCVLALAPNAARLSVRFFFEDNFGTLTANYVKYMQDMEFLPWPTGRALPSISSCVLRTAPARIERGNKVSFDRDHISPLLSGELLRAILTGARFPSALLSHLIKRIRSDHLLDSTRVALVKCLIVREMRIEKRLPKRPDGTPMEEYLVRSDPDDPNVARRLGRLFALIERTQLAALGDEINATVKDKFIGAAAATPQQVFPTLIANAQHHFKRLRNGHYGRSDPEWIKDAQHARRVGAALERDVGMLWASMNESVPAQHSSEEQGLFFVGYYQERFGGGAKTTEGEVIGDQNDPIEGEE